MLGTGGQGGLKSGMMGPGTRIQGCGASDIPVAGQPGPSSRPLPPLHTLSLSRCPHSPQLPRSGGGRATGVGQQPGAPSHLQGKPHPGRWGTRSRSRSP